MSNPVGPDQDATQASEETESAEESHDAVEQEPQPGEEPTEVISTSEPEPEFESAEPTDVISGPAEQDDPTERRYSAPSAFDVRSTEVIHTAPEPATEVITTSSAPGPNGLATAPRNAIPQAIPPRPVTRHRSWALVLLLILVIAVLAVIAVLGTIWFKNKAATKVSQEDLVRQTIEDFDEAIQKGDLAELRGITCGTTRDRYVNYPDEDWAATHQRVAAAKQYPVVASIDQVVVNDQHAEANVTTFMAYAPQVRSTRSFDLQFLDGRWKICEGPIG